MKNLVEKLEDRSDSGTKAPRAIADGSRVAVIGGGPAGSFFSCFVLDLAGRMGIDIVVDIFEPRDFSGFGPASCNMCGGIVSETLVQNLAAEGINLPPTVVQRGIDSYILHTHEGSVRIETPIHEKRIGAVYRASGPRGVTQTEWGSFDGYLQGLSIERGARVRREKVEGISWQDGRPRIEIRDGDREVYDLLVVATGINSTFLKSVDALRIKYNPPRTAKTFICEYYFGPDKLDRHLGSSMHVFLLNIPGLEFAAIIPKGDCASVCVLGDKIDRSMLQSFLESPEVKSCMPAEWDPAKNACQCSPKISTSGALEPFADRIVFIGDAGVTRLYKDGIGAAYRTAKAAAATAVFHGVSGEDFRKHFWPVCRSIEKDNAIGKIVFGVTRVIQKHPVARTAVLRMVGREQSGSGRDRRMSTVLWDTFTGSATYREVFGRTLHPLFLGRLAGDVALAAVVSATRRFSPGRATTNRKEQP
jgi:flavin-dependent dehydrogenase